MKNNGISYIFPQDLAIDIYSLPKTATQDSTSFEPRKHIIEQIIPDKNEILKDILRSNPYMPFGYINKGKQLTKTIEDASNLLDFKKKYILKTLITKDTEDDIYAVVTLGNHRPNIKKIRPISRIFRDAHKIAGPLSLSTLEEELIEDYIGMPAGFCGPVPLDKTYLGKIEGIIIQRKAKNIDIIHRYESGEKNIKKIFITFPINMNESLLMRPRDLYEKLIEKCSKDKVSLFIE